MKSFFLLYVISFSNHINKEDFLYYGMGLGLFRAPNTLEKARNIIEALVDNLKASNLLLETSRIRFVRLHDVVQTVVIIIDGAWSRSMFRPKRDRKPKSNDEFYYY